MQPTNLIALLAFSLYYLLGGENNEDLRHNPLRIIDLDIQQIGKDKFNFDDWLKCGALAIE